MFGSPGMQPSRQASSQGWHAEQQSEKRLAGRKLSKKVIELCGWARGIGEQAGPPATHSESNWGGHLAD